MSKDTKREYSDNNIDQLWYTWSKWGFGTGPGGFRIRAASELLSNPDGERVQELRQYLTYELPKGASAFGTTDEQAPLVLAFIRTSKKCLLISKRFVAKPGTGRDSVFFIHILDNLPVDFSVREAISLWRSPFWQFSDRSLKKASDATLDTVSLQALLQEKTFTEAPLTPLVRVCLPALIDIYLRKKTPVQKDGRAVPAQIILVAPADEVASMIFHLTRILPEQLLEDMTFSTYEYDLASAEAEIVGTCVLSRTPQKLAEDISGIVTDIPEEKQLLINSYRESGVAPFLVSQALLTEQPLAGQFAVDALDEQKRFRLGFLNACTALPRELSTESFLQMYALVSGTPENIWTLFRKTYDWFHRQFASQIDAPDCIAFYEEFNQAFVDLLVDETSSSKSKGIDKSVQQSERAENRRQFYLQSLEKLLLSIADDRPYWDYLVDLFIRISADYYTQGERWFMVSQFKHKKLAFFEYLKKKGVFSPNVPVELTELQLAELI